MNKVISSIGNLIGDIVWVLIIIGIILLAAKFSPVQEKIPPEAYRYENVSDDVDLLLDKWDCPREC